MMAGRVCARILMQCVFIEILLFISAQRDHMINVALNKRCNVSSRYEDNYGNTAGDCHAAINGNTSTEFTMGRSPNCIHTSDNDHHPFWRVYLIQRFTVNRIIIYGREQFRHRMECVRVSLDGSEIFRFPCPGTVNVTNIIDLRPPKQGQVVTITRDTALSGEPTPFLNICEVEILECAVGYYNVSNDCQNTCASGCDGGTCNSSDGRCQCRPGWEGDRCQRCSDKHWGHNCTPCGAGCANKCDVNYGTCQCKTRWSGSLCTECTVGHYNEYNDCQNTCGRGCVGGTCNSSDGRCRCRPGWEADLCQRCSDRHWGKNCSPCGAGCLNNCNVNSGTCQCKTRWAGSLCTDCSDGYYNESNDCQNTCGEGCQDTCSRTDGTCQCRTRWQPPLCQEKFYNAPNDCVTCGRGCHDTCNITDGTCQCRPGWQPPLCQNCADKYYNVSNDCVTCGEGCHDTCNKTDGTCQCQPDWQPPLCQNMTSSNDDKEAPSGSGPVAGIAVGCAIVFFILGVLTGFCLRRSRFHQTSGTRGSFDNISMTCDLVTSSTHPAEQPGTTSSEDTANNSINVYDELKSRNEDNTAAYTSLHFQNKSKESAVPSDYINTRNTDVRQQQHGPH